MLKGDGESISVHITEIEKNCSLTRTLSVEHAVACIFQPTDRIHNTVCVCVCVSDRWPFKWDESVLTDIFSLRHNTVYCLSFFFLYKINDFFDFENVTISSEVQANEGIFEKKSEFDANCRNKNCESICRCSILVTVIVIWLNFEIRCFVVFSFSVFKWN